MSAEVLLETLLEEETEATLLAKLYAVLDAVGIDTESFAPGDPTRSEMYAVARTQEAKEDLITDAIRGGFTDTAEDDWLDVCIESQFDVPRRTATFATCTVRYTNAGNQLHTIAAEDDTFRNSTTDATYKNTTGGTLNPGGTLDVTVEAETAGTGGNALPGEIDELVSTRAGVTVSNITTAAGTDKEPDDDYRIRGKGKLSALSPNGPKGAYDYVVTTPELNGGASVTRSRTFGNSQTGVVQVYVAGASGAVTGDDVDLCQEAVEQYAEPICIGATVVSAANLTQAVTYSLWVYDSINLTSEEIETAVSTALAAAILARRIGGDVIPPDESGNLYKDIIEQAIMRAVYPHGFRVTVTTPAADVPMDLNQVAVLGTVTATAINIVEAP